MSQYRSDVDNGYLNRDLAYGTILMKFSEQGHVGRPDFKCYQPIHDIDVTRCDSISYNIVRLLKEEFPTFNSDVAQSLRQQYEGATMLQQHHPLMKGCGSDGSCSRSAS